MNIIKNRQRRIDLYKMAKGCERCGYNRHPSALCFDHLPGTDKAEITKNGYSKRSCAGGIYKMYAKKYSVKELIAEIRKCRLLCANCHMEVTHANNPRAQNLPKPRLKKKDKDKPKDLPGQQFLFDMGAA